MRKATSIFYVTAVASAMTAMGVLAGCGANPIAPVTPIVSTPGVQGVAISGLVHGGQQPVTNSRIYLYAVGSTGYGSAYPYTTGTDLLGSHVVTSDANGNFSISNDYTCPSATTEIYLVASGGNPISGLAANSNLALMAAFGPCNSPAANANTSVMINELSTVAAVYALAPFMTGPANVGTSSTNATGLTNAFSAVNKLVTLATGYTPGPALPAGATIPTAELDTLADIIASCVNSTGGSAPSGVSDGSLCGNLFALTPNASSVYPTDTITALLNIAKNPSQNVTALNNLSSTVAPFQPTLGNTPPSAWTVAITYAPVGLSGPAGIASDQQGNVWISNKTSKSVTLLAPTGAVTGTYATGVTGSGAIAVDPSGNAWTPGTSNSLIEVPAGGGTYKSVTGGGLGTTNALAIDGLGQIWATGSQNGVSVFTNSGTPVSSSAYTGAGVVNAQSIAITSH